MNENQSEHDKLLIVKNLDITYTTGSYIKKAVDNVTFNIYKQQLTLVMGASGCGKTSLVNAIGGLLTPSAGTIHYKDTCITDMGRTRLSKYRKDHVSFIFQHYNLIPDLTAKENVDVAGAIVENPIPSLDALEMVGLRDQANQYPGQMSGGQQQRVCIARAIAKNSELILCDEPTGALDTENSIQVVKLLDSMAHEHGMAVVIITHNPALKDLAEHYIEMSDGKIIKNIHNCNAKSVDGISFT